MIEESYNNHKLTNRYIKFKRVESYFKATALLQGFCFVCIIICYWNWSALSKAAGWSYCFHLYFVFYFFSLIITSQLDAKSRYQNYKMAKDLLNEYGFRKVMFKVFSKSRCQRDAAKEAARSMGYHSEAIQCFHEMGFRWYHILPVLIVKYPQTLFSKAYWQSTFFVKEYKSNYFYW